MAATNFTPIQLYFSTTASAVPLAANLAQGELAINITDGKLYYEDNAGVVQVIATKGAGTIGGSTTQIQYNNAGALAGNAAMTFNSGTSTTTLTTLNLTNALGAIYGGTAQSTYTQGDFLYASATNTLSKLGIGTVNYILTSTGSVPQWSAPSSIIVQTATNLAGGLAGSVPYQSAVDTTTFLAIGAANRVMTSTGTAPQWVTSLTGLTGVSSSSITNTSLTSGRVVVSTTAGLQADDADLTFDGTTLSAGGFSTVGLSTLVKTVTIGNSSFNGSAVFAAATPAKLYIGTGTVTDTTSAIGATNAVGAVSSLAITPIAATNTSVTYTNAATLYIAGAPSAGTNVTLTNPYSLYVAAGASYFGGAVTFASSIGALTVSSLTDTGLTSGRVTYATTGGLLTDSANLTFSGSALAVTGTLSATGKVAFGTATLSQDVTIKGASGQTLVELQAPDATIGGYIGVAGNAGTIFSGTVARDLCIRGEGTNIKLGFSNNAPIGTFTSAGLAVTGTLSASGLITATAGVVVGTGTGTYVAGSLGFSNANEGFVYRPPVAGLNTAHNFQTFGGSKILGITESGAVQVTGTLSVSSTISTGAGGVLLNSAGISAGSVAWFGGDSSATSWYFNAPTGNAIRMGINNTYVTALTSTGLAVTGDLSATGAVTLTNNSVNQLILTGSGTAATRIQILRGTDDPTQSTQFGWNGQVTERSGGAVLSQVQGYNFVFRGTTDATPLALTYNTVAVTGTLSASGNLSTTSNLTVGSSGNGGQVMTTLQGYSPNSVNGSYGSLLFSANSNYTGSACRFLLTNALDANSFAIIRSVDPATTPTLNSVGAVSSGSADFVINSSGNASFVGSATSAQYFQRSIAPGTEGGTETPVVTTGNGSVQRGGMYALNDYANNFSTTLIFKSNATTGSATERARIPAAGGFQSVNSISVGNATPSASGAGLTFPATQSASTDANTLDDYEEGVFIVTFTPSTSGTITLSNTYKTLSYTKVGRVVTVSGELLVTSSSTPIGSSVSIGNLPFAVATGFEFSAASPILDLGTGTYAPARVIATTNYIDLRVNASTIGTNYNIIVGFSYMTST
jgi:hypothetical protein